MKEFARRHGIATGRFHVVTRRGGGGARHRGFCEPPVVKADGLCAGKGVVVAESSRRSAAAARAMLSGEAFGAAGEPW